METVLVGIVALALGVGIGFLVRKAVAQSQSQSAEARAQKVVLEAEREAERLTREALVEAKDEIGALRREAEESLRSRREEVERQEQRLTQKEASLDRNVVELEQRAEELTDRDKKLQMVRQQLEQAAEQHRTQLEIIARMTQQEAREALMAQMVDEAKRSAMQQVREIEQRAREDGEERARKIVTIAIQRVASEQTSESTVSVFSLPSEDMKGRIIGREGRNIRAFEAATGVNLIIDDTPEAVVLSCFDPVRRETARMTLEKLVADGRIHPARIEEMHERSQREIEEQIRRAGEEATMEVGIADIHPEMIKLLGRLQFRTSYGQNVLKHLVESAHIAASISAELGIDPTVAKRGAFLHDIGKAVTHEVEGSHAIIGAEIARRLKETPEVVHCIESHHGEVEQRTIDAVLAQISDGISGGRPGARRESLETYVKRLERLEEICTSYPGVEKTYAMQAGREVRVMVKPVEIDDLQAQVMARDIAKQVEEELQYPGQIKITVVRETRSVEYAK
ncbi:MAG: ribonuclease Y [Actinobacteria bacterium RBG_19FT_COMBO_70_19]|nr:MAG: ribonuclease Y [Actinobacteria bacterium RBG_19FT_COMBO_70_19]